MGGKFHNDDNNNNNLPSRIAPISIWITHDAHKLTHAHNVLMIHSNVYEEIHKALLDNSSIRLRVMILSLCNKRSEWIRRMQQRNGVREIVFLLCGIIMNYAEMKIWMWHRFADQFTLTP